MGEMREYTVRGDERVEGVVILIDKAATSNQKLNRFVTAEEYAKLFPDRKKQMAYIRFGDKERKECGIRMAAILIRKFPSLEIVSGNAKAATVIPDNKTQNNSDAWQKLLQKVDELKIILSEKGIPLPKVGRSVQEKNAFVEEAEKLLGNVE